MATAFYKIQSNQPILLPFHYQLFHATKYLSYFLSLCAHVLRHSIIILLSYRFVPLTISWKFHVNIVFLTSLLLVSYNFSFHYLFNHSFNFSIFVYMSSWHSIFYFSSLLSSQVDSLFAYLGFYFLSQIFSRVLSLV